MLTIVDMEDTRSLPEMSESAQRVYEGFEMTMYIRTVHHVRYTYRNAKIRHVHVTAAHPSASLTAQCTANPPPSCRPTIVRKPRKRVLTRSNGSGPLAWGFHTDASRRNVQIRRCRPSENKKPRGMESFTADVEIPIPEVR